MKQHTQYHLKKYLVFSLLLTMSVLIVGCEIAGMVAYAIGGEQKENVPAQYRGLENSRFAVLVAADENTLYQSPEAPRAICTAVTRELATHVPGAIAVPPQQLVDYQEQNPYWTTVPYDRILAQLDVEQLVIVDIVQYQIHDKGNASVWRGTAVTNISVAQRTNANTLSFSKVVKATYPVGTSIGVVDAEDQSFRLALLQNLCTAIGHLFYDYQVIQD